MVDTLSAGDVFHGAFAFAVAAGKTVRRHCCHLNAGHNGHSADQRGSWRLPSVCDNSAPDGEVSGHVGVGQVRAAGELGCVAAAIKCTRFGGRRGCPGWAEVAPLLSVAEWGAEGGGGPWRARL